MTFEQALPPPETVTIDGKGFTVNWWVAKHPVLNIYEIVTVPAATPVTIPEIEAIVATEVLLLIHVPPPELFSVLVVPVQTKAIPLIADGFSITVT